MLKLYDKGVYLLNGTEIVEEKEAVAAKTGKDVTPQEAACLLYTSPSPRDRG